MLYIEHFGLGENRQQRRNDMGNFLSWPDALAQQCRNVDFRVFRNWYEEIVKFEIYLKEYVL